MKYFSKNIYSHRKRLHILKVRVCEAECVELGGDGGGERHPRQALRVLGAGGGVVRHDVQRHLSLEVINVSLELIILINH